MQNQLQTARQQAAGIKYIVIWGKEIVNIKW